MRIFEATISVALGLCLAGLYPSECVGSAIPAKSSLALTVTLDGGDFLESQPILALISLENRGQRTYRDVGPLEPTMGQLRFRLTNSVLGNEVPWQGGQTTLLHSGEGITLSPATKLCEVVNILACFGEYDPDFRDSELAVKEYYLPPGSYELQAEVDTRIGWVHGLPMERARSVVARFTIHPLDTDPTEVGMLRAYAQECKARGGSCWNTASAEAWLETGLRSRFFYRFFSDLGQRIFGIDLATLVTQLHAAGAGPATIATVVSWKVNVEPRGDRDKLQWIRELEHTLDSGVEQSVLRSWRLRIEQGRYYHSFGP